MINFAYESLFKKDSVYKNMYVQIRETGNILRYPYFDSTKTLHDITMEARADGSVRFHGTRSSVQFDKFYLVKGTVTADMVGKKYNFVNTTNFVIQFAIGGINYSGFVRIKEEWLNQNYDIAITYTAQKLTVDEVCYPYIWVGESNVLRNDEIYEEELELHESLCSSENIEFGSCESNYITFTTSRVNESFKGKTIVVWTQLDNKNDGYLCYGLFKVAEDNLTADRSKREITAYDSLYEILNADVADWYNTLFPDTETTHTLREVRDSFFGQFGELQIETTLPNDSITIYKTTDTNSLSGYDVLYAICQINGCFGHFGRDGYFHYIFIDTEKGLFPSQTLFPNDKIYPRVAGKGTESEEIGENGTYISCQYEDYYVHQINKVVIRETSQDVGVIYGTGDNVFLIENNFLLYGNEEIEDIAENLYNKISGVWYTPCEIEAQGNPCIEVGDNIHIYFKNEKKVATVLLQRTLKGIQALRDVYISEGTEYRGTELNVFNKQVLKIQGKTNSLERTAERTISQLEDLSDFTDSRFEQTSTAISAKLSKVSPTGQTSFSWEMTDSKMEWKSNGNTIMKTDSTGLEVKGKVTATSGYIGNGASGFTINNTSIYNGMTSYGDTSHNGVYVGTDGIATGKGSFKVDNGGNITANSGKLGTWDFSSNGFTYSNGQGATAQMTPSGSGGLGGVVISSQSAELSGSRESRLGNSSSTNTNVEGQSVLIKSTSNNSVVLNANGKTKVVGGLLVRDSADTSDTFVAPQTVGGTTYIWGRYAYYNGSDRRMKEDISELNEDTASEFIMNLKPSEYRMKGESRKHHGFIAQEVKEVMNEDWAVYLEDTDEEKTLSLCYSELIADMVCTLQKQNKQIQLLQKQIQELKGEQNDLR